MTEPLTVTEWGVRYAYDGSVHVDSHGPSQALARCAVDTYKAITTVPRQDVTLVTRQVHYDPWQEVTPVTDGTWDPNEEVLPYDPDEDGLAEPELEAAAQDADAETSQDEHDHDGEDSPAHDANPF